MSALSTTTSPSPAPSPPAPALTAPYVFPAKCSNIYNVTSSSTVYQSFASLSEAYLYVDTSASHWQSCQPPERRNIDEHFNHSAYSGIVCPKGWTAWSVGLQSKYNPSSTSSTWSTAFCCGSGHALVDDIWSIYSPSYNHKICIETFPPSPSSNSATPLVFTTGTYNSSYPFFVEVASATTDSSASSTPVPITRTFSTHSFAPLIITFSGRAFYPPWSVYWEAADNPTLSPAWPTLTNDMLIPSWVPGDEARIGVFDNKGAGPLPVVRDAWEMAWALPVMVVLGVLLGLSLLGLGVLWWRVRKLTREVRWREGVKDENSAVVWDGNRNGNGNAVAIGVAERGRCGHARRVSVSNGERAKVVDVRRSGRGNPLQNSKGL